MKILHIKNILNIDLPLESINLEEKEKRNSLVYNTVVVTNKPVRNGDPYAFCASFRRWPVYL